MLVALETADVQMTKQQGTFNRLVGMLWPCFISGLECDHHIPGRYVMAMFHEWSGM